jgi:maltose O-acetyltransferase
MNGSEFDVIEWNREPVALKPVFRRLASSMFNAIQGSGFVSIPMRAMLLKMFGAKLGKDCCIYEGSAFGRPNKLFLGDGVFINAGCRFDDSADIIIGTNVYIAACVQIITGTHRIGGPTCRAGRHESRPVSIGQGSWIGAAVTILPDVMIGTGCVVAAGSVVTTSLEPNGLYAGVPARRVRDLEEGDEWLSSSHS